MEVEWRAFELHPETPREGAPRVQTSERAKQGRQHLRQMAQEAGLEMGFRDRISNSRLALEAAEYARSQGKLEKLNRALFLAYWKDGKDIGNLAVVEGLAEGAGLDPAGLRQALEEQTFAPLVEEQITGAHRADIHAVPTFIFDGRYAVQGAQPYAVFKRVMEEYVLAPTPEDK